MNETDFYINRVLVVIAVIAILVPSSSRLEFGKREGF